MNSMKPFRLDDSDIMVAPGGCATAVLDPFDAVIVIVIIAIILNPPNL